MIYPPESRLSAHISWAEEHDYAQIVAIYNHYVKNSPCTFDTATLNVSGWRERVDSDAFPLLVYGRSGNILGFAYGSRFRPKDGYRWTAEVSVYIAPDALGKGIGRALYLDLLRILSGQGYCNLMAVLTVPAAASVALHHAFGFAEVGSIPHAGYKLGRWHDLSILQLALPKPPADQPVWPPLAAKALRALPAIVAEVPSDHPDVALFIRTLDDYHDSLYPPEHNYQESSASLSESKSTVFIARKGLLAVGMAALKPKQEPEQEPQQGGGYGELKRMYVSPLFRGQGVAAALLAHLERVARQQGLNALKLETGDKQTPAIQLYLRHGFRECEPFGDYEDHGTNVFMHKPLS